MLEFKLNLYQYDCEWKFLEIRKNIREGRSITSFDFASGMKKAEFQSMNRIY